MMTSAWYASDIGASYTHMQKRRDRTVTIAAEARRNTINIPCGNSLFL
jgi:hypothetical protein